MKRFLQSVALSSENILPIHFAADKPFDTRGKAEPGKTLEQYTLVGKEIVPSPGYCVELNPILGGINRGIGVISEVYFPFQIGNICDQI